MGMNYYAAYDTREVHLGKLSKGWLPTIPQRNYHAWLAAVNEAPLLVDEYGTAYTPREIVDLFHSHAVRGGNVKFGGEPVDSGLRVRFDHVEGYFS